MMGKIIKKNKKIAILGLFLFIIAIILIIFGLAQVSRDSEDKNNVKEINRVLPKVRVFDISKERENNNYLTFKGIVEPQAEVSITSLINGQVISLAKDVGETVNHGDVLALLNNNEIRSSLDSARISFLNAEQSLFEIKLSVQTQINQAELRVKNAELALELAKEQLKNTQESNNKDLASAEKNVDVVRLSADQAEHDLDNVKAMVVASNASFVSQGQSLYNSLMVLLENIADQTEDITNQQSDIRGVFGSLNTLYRTDADQKNSQFLIDIKAFAQEEGILDYETLEEKLVSLKSVLKEGHGAISATILALNNTATDTGFTSLDLESFKMVYSGYEASVTFAIQSADSLLASVQTTELSNSNRIKASETGKQQVDISLENAMDVLASAKAKFKTSLAVAQKQLKESENGLAAAKKDLEQSEISAKLQILTAETGLANVKLQFDSASKHFNELTITSPIHGIITKREADIGQEVSPGRIIYEVKNIDSIKIIVEVPSEGLNAIGIGETVKIGDNFSGVVIAKEPELSSSAKKGIVKILYTGHPLDLTLGSFIDVKIPHAGDSAVILIPLKAVILNDSKNTVRLFENGKIITKEVALGSTRGEYIEVIEGLLNSDILVLEGADFLEDGQEVQVILNTAINNRQIM